MFLPSKTIQYFEAGVLAQRSDFARPLAAIFLSFLFVTAGLCSAETTSLTGTLGTPESIEAYAFSLSATGNVTLQTYGFGGGLNAANTNITAGGFDPFVGLFSGTGNGAVFIDGTADNLTNYVSEPAACPPAGFIEIGSVSGQCGDVKLQFSGLSAGSYTVILTDAGYIPNAVYEAPGGTLGDGFSDLTGGSLPFSTCYDASDCNTDTANWALDVTTPTIAPATPEPASLGLAGIGLFFTIGFWRQFHSCVGQRVSGPTHNKF